MYAWCSPYFALFILLLMMSFHFEFWHHIFRFFCGFLLFNIVIVYCAPFLIRNFIAVLLVVQCSSELHIASNTTRGVTRLEYNLLPIFDRLSLYLASLKTLAKGKAKFDVEQLCRYCVTSISGYH
jgi:hypothetical protein